MFGFPGSRVRPQIPFRRRGHYDTFLTVTAPTQVTLPSCGTLAAIDVSQTWTKRQTLESVGVYSLTFSASDGGINTGITVSATGQGNIIFLTRGNGYLLGMNEAGGQYCQLVPGTSYDLGNYVQIVGSSNGGGNPPYLQVISQNNVDTNVGFKLGTRGTGSINLYTQSQTTLVATISSAGITQYTSTYLMKSGTTLNNGSSASAGTIANAPAAGNPTKWIPIDDNGTPRYIPAW